MSLSEKMEDGRLILEFKEAPRGIGRLLELVAKDDPYFRYNVPAASVVEFQKQTEAEAIAFLRDVYARQEVMIEEPDDIARFMGNHGDRVIKKGDFSNGKKIKQGDVGYIVNPDQAEPTITFIYGNIKVPIEQLMVKRRRGLLRRYVPLTPMDVTKNRTVYYNGEQGTVYRDYIPDGANGLVAAHFKKDKIVDVVWERKKTSGLEQWRTTYSNFASSPSFHFYSYDELKLVMNNTVDFEQILKKYKTMTDDP